MLDPDFLDLLERLARSLRVCELPFGGIQVIFAGDFCQLPPVVLLGGNPRYAFSSNCWNALFTTNSFILTKVFRQSGDPRLMSILRELRSGSLSPESIHILLSECQDRDTAKGTPMLFPLNNDVDKANKICLNAIAGHEWENKARDTGVDVKQLGTLLVPALLILKVCISILISKVGAIVMYLMNDYSTGLCNGSLGTVVGFVNGSPQVKFDDLSLPIVLSTESFSIEGGDCGTQILAKRVQVVLFIFNYSIPYLWHSR
jgi:hypothetical protein